jgi:hypothetical protein
MTYHTVTPNNWAGLFATIGCILAAYLWIVLLFGWDSPEKTKHGTYQDILRTHLDMFRDYEEAYRKLSLKK